MAPMLISWVNRGRFGAGRAVATVVILMRHRALDAVVKCRLGALQRWGHLSRRNAARWIPPRFAYRSAVLAYETYLSTSDPRYLRDAVEWRTLAQNFRRSEGLRIERKMLIRLVLTGWAADFNTDAAGGMFVVSPSPTEIRTRMNRPRPDVARAFGRTELQDVGYELLCTYEELPERIRVEVAIDGEVQEALPTEAVFQKYPDLVSEIRDQWPPRLAYLDGVDITSVVRRRIRWRRDALVNTKLSLLASVKAPLPALELAAEVEDRESLRALFRQFGWHRVSAGTDFRIDRLRFTNGIESEAASANRFKTVPWRLLGQEGEPSDCAVFLPTTVRPSISEPSNGDDRDITVRLTRPVVSEVRNVCHVHGHLIISPEEELLVADPAARPDLDFVAGQWDIVHGSHRRRHEAMVLQWGEVTHSLESAASLIGRVGFNYFHSMVEYLPRLVTLELHPHANTLPILVNDDLVPVARTALSRLVDESRVVPVNRGDVVEISRLLVPGFHTNHRDSTMEPWWKGAGIYWPVLEEFRSRLMSSVTPCDGPNRVFLVRPGSSVNGRGLRNQDHLVEVAERFGFTPVDPGSLDLDGQINLIRNAEVVVGPGGASMANLLFAHEKLVVLSLVSHHLKDFAMFATLASHAGAKYYTLTGPSNRHLGRTEFHRDVFHGDFWIDPREFKNALRQLTQSSVPRHHGVRW